MIMFKILSFYVLLTAFIAASWLWHRVWFGRGIVNLSDARSDSRNKGIEPGAGQTVSLTAGALTVTLVIVMLGGLYLVIYYLLA